MVTAKSTIVSLPLAIASLILSASAADNCWWRSGGSIRPQPGWFACNNTQVGEGKAKLCCFGGTSCGDDSLCHANNSNNGDQYYVGGCTDGSYGDPVCRSSCTGDDQTWVSWNGTENKWHCCGDSGCLAGTVTDETFTAISPNQWTPVPQSQTSTSSATSSATVSSTSSVSSTPTTSASASTTPSSSPSAAGDSELSTGATAGIGVAAAVGGIALIAGAVFLFIRNKRKSRAAHNNDYESRWQDPPMDQVAPHQGESTYDPKYSSVPVEEPVEAASPEPQEIAGRETPRVELMGDETFRDTKK